MANPATTTNDPNKLPLGDNNFEDKTILSGENLVINSVLGAVAIAKGTATADGGNTGNGTVTALALAAGGPAKIGSWILTCIDDAINDAIATGNQSGPTGTGNGTVTELAPNALGAPAKVGSYILTCIETITNGGRFQLADPDGIIVASDILIAAGAGGVIVFVGAGLTFKITDGSTDFVAGDYFGFDVTGSHGGRFQLADPDGLIVNDRIDIAAGAGGVIVFTGNGLTFTITDAGTDFANDDFFTITVVAGSGKLKLCVSTSVDGSELARYITTAAIDASLSDLAARPLKSGDVRQSLLVFGGSDTFATVVHGLTHKENLRDFGIYSLLDNVNDRLEP